jgi:hypothetical protein
MIRCWMATLKTIFTPIIMIALLVSIFSSVHLANAQVSSITILPDGSLSPSTNDIQVTGNVYAITADLNLSLDIQKSDIIIDGANHNLNGPENNQNGVAITLGANNVTITRLHISNWQIGLHSESNGNTIINNVILNNNQAIVINGGSNVVSGNIITNCSTAILINTNTPTPQATNNIIIQNQLSYNNWAFDILSGSGTTINQNNVIDNSVILTLGTINSKNSNDYPVLYQNNFINNNQVLHIPNGQPFISSVTPISPAGIWDNGSIGNYWSDYLSKYPNAKEIDNTGIGNTTYQITETLAWSRESAQGEQTNGVAVLGIANDHYPLINPIVNTSPTQDPTLATAPSIASSSNSLVTTLLNNVTWLLFIVILLIAAIATAIVIYKKKSKNQIFKS